MVKNVIKRDGRIVLFDKRKIVDAILKAMNVTEDGEDIVLAHGRPSFRVRVGMAATRRWV